jgi:hypothetical protein
MDEFQLLTLGRCGTTADYCGSGCQSLFGSCGVSIVTITSSAGFAPLVALSDDGSCGSAANGGRGFQCNTGECCSQYGTLWCSEQQVGVELQLIIAEPAANLPLELVEF